MSTREKSPLHIPSQRGLGLKRYCLPCGLFLFHFCSTLKSIS